MSIGFVCFYFYYYSSTGICECFFLRTLLSGSHCVLAKISAEENAAICRYTQYSCGLIVYVCQVCFTFTFTFSFTFENMPLKKIFPFCGRGPHIRIFPSRRRTDRPGANFVKLGVNFPGDVCTFY